MGSALGLKRAEGRVGVTLVMPKIAGEIDDEWDVTTHTLRFHMKQKQTKLGLSRQTDLVWLALS